MSKAKLNDGSKIYEIEETAYIVAEGFKTPSTRWFWNSSNHVIANDVNKDCVTSGEETFKTPSTRWFWNSSNHVIANDVNRDCVMNDNKAKSSEAFSSIINEYESGLNNCFALLIHDKLLSLDESGTQFEFTAPNKDIYKKLWRIKKVGPWNVSETKKIDLYIIQYIANNKVLYVNHSGDKPTSFAIKNVSDERDPYQYFFMNSDRTISPAMFMDYRISIDDTNNTIIKEGSVVNVSQLSENDVKNLAWEVININNTVIPKNDDSLYVPREYDLITPQKININKVVEAEVPPGYNLTIIKNTGNGFIMHNGTDKAIKFGKLDFLKFPDKKRYKVLNNSRHEVIDDIYMIALYKAKKDGVSFITEYGLIYESYKPYNLNCYEDRISIAVCIVLFILLACIYLFPFINGLSKSPYQKPNDYGVYDY